MILFHYYGFILWVFVNQSLKCVFRLQLFRILSLSLNVDLFSF